VRRVLQAADESHVPFLASALTFDALLAAVPFVLLLLIGVAQLVQALATGSGVDPTTLLHSFLPPHASGENDPFTVIEKLLTGIAENSGTISLYAIPTFLWFSTRLFAGVRTSLNHVFDVSVRPSRRRNFLASFGLGKARDAAMVVGTVLLFMVNSALTAAFTIVQARGAESRYFGFVFTTLGRVTGELITILFSVSLFYVVYKYASVRRLPWRTALLAASFAAIAFELAKRLYALYLQNFATLRAPAGDANIAAIGLFVLWVYYTALVFLLGGVVAETWELRRMQHRQRAILR
jgi:membrane protein